MLTLILTPLRVGAVALSPAVQELAGAPGTVVSSSLTIINANTREQTYFLGVMKFLPTEDGKSPIFLPYDEDHTGLAQWIVLPFESFRVQSNSKGEIPFEIAIPKGTSPGGYYAAITVSQSPSDLVATNGAVIEAKTAAMILLTVQGDLVERLALLNFSDLGSSVRSVFNNGFYYRVQNQGTVHLTPEGAIAIKDFFGRTVASFDANATKGRVLPNSTRRYEIESQLDNAGFFSIISEQMSQFAIGPMTAEFDLRYGNSPETIHAQTSFWYVPWQLILVVVLLTAMMIGLLIRKRRVLQRL